MREGWSLDDGTETARRRQDLADLASETLGIPRRRALFLADRYLRQSEAGTSFLAWIGLPVAQHRNASPRSLDASLGRALAFPCLSDSQTPTGRARWTSS
jgi:hypothetical protein